MNIGARIKRLLDHKGMTQALLASMIGKSPVFVHKVIKKDTIDTGDLESIAKVLGVPITYFFDSKSSLPISANDDIEMNDVSPTQSCKFCLEKNRIIEIQHEMIEFLKKYNLLLENNNKQLINNQ